MEWVIVRFYYCFYKREDNSRGLNTSLAIIGKRSQIIMDKFIFSIRQISVGFIETCIGRTKSHKHGE